MQDLSQEQAMVLDTLRKMVTEEIEPTALERDQERRFGRPAFDKLAEAGFAGLLLCEEQGGVGMGMVSFVLALHELGRGCGSTARVLLVHSGQCGKALEGVEGAGELTGQIASGARLCSFVGAEFEIDQDGEGLRGTAELVTAATEAEVFVVAARGPNGEPRLCAVEATEVEVAPIEILGLRASAPGRITFQGGGQVLADGAPARAAIERAELVSSLGAGAIAIGLAEASYARAFSHAHERIAFGKPLFAQQAVGHKLVASLRAARAGRALVLEAARLVDAGDRGAREAAMLAKIQGVEAAISSADEAIQVHGGYGFTIEYHVERHYRDAKTLEVLDRGQDWLRDRLVEGLEGPRG